MLAYGDLDTHMDLNFGGSMDLYLASCIQVFMVYLAIQWLICVCDDGFKVVDGENSSIGLVVVVMDSG